MHLLVWLKDIKHIQYKLIHADIPTSNPEVAFLAEKLQKSDRIYLPLCNECNAVVKENGREFLKIHHPAEAYTKNLRAYISTVLPLLKCSMDVQVTDSKAMVLRYVTSYVTKWQDAFENDALYSTHVTSFQAALRHLQEVEVCLPEIALQLSSTKIPWTSSRTKGFVPAKHNKATDNASYAKYRRRSPEQEDRSFLEWLRKMQDSIAQPKPYKQGSTLVGVRYCSPFNDEFFFQDLLMNFPHRRLEDLYHPLHERREGLIVTGRG